jgi:hypothetical protein
MLGNELVKRLSSRNWVDVMKYGGNPTQTWSRIKIKANRAIKHLTLLAEKMPEEKQKEIFDERKIFSLMRAAVFARNPVDIEAGLGPRSPFDARRTKLASTLVMVGIHVCKMQYNLLMKDTPDLGEPIISHLTQAVAMCRDIAYRSELMEIDTDAEKQGTVYLFEWNKLANVGTTRYTRRFAEFIMKETEFMDIELEPIQLSKNGKEIQGTFREFETAPSWSFLLELHEDDYKTDVGLKVFDENGNQRAYKNLIAEKDGDSIYVYEKKKK